MQTYAKACKAYSAIWDKDHAAKVAGQHYGDNNAHVVAYLAPQLAKAARQMDKARRAL